MQCFLDRGDGPTGWDDNDQVLRLLQMLCEFESRPRLSKSFEGARRRQQRRVASASGPPAPASVPSFRATLLIS